MQTTTFDETLLERTLGIALAIAASIFAAGDAPAQPPADLMLENVTSGLSSPVAMRHAGDGSGRLFVVEQGGRIMIYDLGSDMLLSTPFLDLTSEVDVTGGEQGLLGLAFHPDFATNGFFYVNYTYDPGPGLDRTRIERYTVDAGDPDLADTSTAFTVLEIAQDFSNHNGGDIHFGPDGYLYVGMGDGGSGEDPNNRAQSLDSLLGKILRIDVDAAAPPGPNDLCGLVTNYGIPAGNPHAGGSGDCDEIWALGVRNPWRFSFDRLVGDLFFGDVGQGPLDPREEVSFQPASSSGGENYGWSCAEGDLMPNYNPCLPGPLTPPILVYGHGDGNCSITGGYRYRGSTIGGLAGLYVYGDFCSGRVYFAEETGPGVWSSSEWDDLPGNVSAFGEDADGELYVVFLGGQIQRFESPSAIFTDGFESGDTSIWTLEGP